MMTASSLPALSLQTVLQREIAIISDNLANISSPGFQRTLLPHQESLTGKGVSELSLVQDLATVRDLRQGAFKQTGDSYHVYLSGEGYFAVQTPLGTRYTRNGVFTLDSRGNLVTMQGHPVLDAGQGPITLPEGIFDVAIASDGTISDNTGVIAQIGRFSFKDMFALKAEEGTLLSTDQQAEVAENTSIIQYGFEQSNTDPVLETTSLIDVLRKFQQVQKFIEEEGRMISDATSRLLRIAPAA